MRLFGAVLAITTLVLLFTDFDFIVIWPSVLALSIVWLTRSTIAGLLTGALFGVILLSKGDLLEIPQALVNDHLLSVFDSRWKVGAILFTFILGGFVHLLEKGGLLQALLFRLVKGNDPRRLESGAAVFGLLCFFDGLANSLMVGRVFQPIADSTRLSRLRLAYIVDTTSAAVACLAFISTWIAFQLAMIQEGYTLAGYGDSVNPYSVYFASLPYNYYALFSLFIMLLAILSRLDLGAMAQKDQLEQMEKGHDESFSKGALPVASEKGIWRVTLPLAFLILYVFVGIYANGVHRINEAFFPLNISKLSSAFGEADVPLILVTGSLLASLLAGILFPKGSIAERGSVFMEGMVQLFQPVLILMSAWILSSVLSDLGVADWLGQAVEDWLPIQMIPVSIFILSALVAFTTGTSWGTMGLVMPLAIPLVFQLGGSASIEIIPVVVGAVFSGAVFGDHCSPLSDTTIVSSFASGVSPFNHVKTQMPYAVLAAFFAALLGFLPSGYFRANWITLFAGIVLVAIVWYFIVRRFGKTDCSREKA